MTCQKKTIGVVGQFYRAPNGETRLFTLNLVEAGETHDKRSYVSQREYDVEWSKRHGYLFHNSGGRGGNVVTVAGLFFCSGDVEIERERCQLVHHADKPPWRHRKTTRIRKINATRRMMRLPQHIQIESGQSLFDWLCWNGIEQDAVYCSECRDWVRGDELCAHCWWCKNTGWYSTPSNRCNCIGECAE